MPMIVCGIKSSAMSIVYIRVGSRKKVWGVAVPNCRKYDLGGENVQAKLSHTYRTTIITAGGHPIFFVPESQRLKKTLSFLGVR